MNKRLVSRAGVAMAALVLLAAGCGDDDDGAADDTTTTAADGGDETTTTAGDGDDGEALEIIALDYAFDGLPEELPAGVLEFSFVNEGEADHEIVFIEIGDTPADQFFEDFGPVIQEGAPFPDYVGALVGANEAGPGATADYAYSLSEGSYIAFCALTGTPEDPEGEDGAPHFAQGMQQLVTVTAGDEGELPEADGTITASDYTFDIDLSGGDAVINYTNEGPNDHFAGFDIFPEGTTPEAAEEAFATLLLLEEGQAPPEGTLESSEVGFSGIASAGRSLQFEVPGGFEAGRTYIFYCFIQDRTGGPPHAIGNQMYKAFTIE